MSCQTNFATTSPNIIEPTAQNYNLDKGTEPQVWEQDITDFTENTCSNAILSHIKPGLRTLKNFDKEKMTKFYQARQQLILKEIETSLTPEENIELTYLNWQIDRYEMAKYANDFNALEDVIRKHTDAVDVILKAAGLSAYAK
ncbi:MAG: hypothetical protein PHF29_08055 [Candidatus Riflebacteria bacterium]|nr:hypothetical protein [Candidatus Riflebacteria bacterium]